MANVSDDEHPNVKFGNPLELYDDTNLPSKQSTVPIHEQTVTDEEGRRRFHGAFTGGFSAGYYNTVGSKDGWTPSTFKSSRKDKEKAKRATFRPQDFMDEEDMGDYGIAPKTVMAKQDFSSTRKRNYEEERLIRDHKQNATMFLGPDLLQSLVVPARKNIGVRLLKKLGWKEGQGVGARVHGKKPISSIEAIKRIYGCGMPPSEQENKNSDALTNNDNEDNRCFEDITFAPKDTMSISITVKDDVHGIGYSGLNPSQALRGNIERSTAVQIHTKSGAKMSFKGQAFGVGAFEEDDDDIYAMDSMENYDISMSGEKNPDSTYGWTKPAAITGAEQREAIAERASNEVKGFVAAKSNKLLTRLNYPPPRVPSDFDPNRRWKLHEESKRIAAMKLQASVQSAVIMEAESQFKQLNADDRHAILDGDGEKAKISGPPDGKIIKSIFDLVSLEDRQRLKRVTSKPDELGFKGKVEEASVVNTKKQEVHDPSKPLCDVKKLKPFSGNLSKQRRYEEFERAVRQRKKDPYRDIVSNLTEWERNQERQEFSRAAQVYLHLANSINTKFEKAKTDEDEKMEDPLNNEVGKKKIFGVLTHDNVEWHPDPLLCRRFNVPDPYPDSDLVGVESNSIFSSLRAIETSRMEPQRGPKEDENEQSVNPAMRAVGVVSDTRRPPTFSHAKHRTTGRWDEEPQEFGPKSRPEAAESSQQSAIKEEDSPQSEEEEEEEEKPSMDLFKSIFADASDDEDTSSEEEEEEIQQPIIKPQTVKVEKISHVFTKPIPKASESEKVDERISHVFTKPLPSKEKTPSKPLPPDEHQIVREDFSSSIISPDPCTDSNKVLAEEEDVYGPPLPPPTKAHLPARPQHLRSFSSSSSDDEYFEKKSKKHKKKKSKKEKKKKSKKKSKR